MTWLSHTSAFDIAGAVIGLPLGFYNWIGFRNLLDHEGADLRHVAITYFPAVITSFMGVFGLARCLGAHL